MKGTALPPVRFLAPRNVAARLAPARRLAGRALSRAVASARRHPWWWAGGAAVLALLILLATCRGGGKEKISYREHVVERGDLVVTVSSPGEVSPQNRLALKPPLAGRIEKILVREGENVKKNQILAWISPPERAALLDAARLKGPEEAAKWEDAYKAAPLVAPINGFIILRSAEPGQTIGSNDAPLVMADRLIVRAQVDETDMGRIRVGQASEVTLDAYPGVRLPARVDHLAFEARSVNNVTVYDIELELLKESRILRSGMTATASVVVTQRRNVVLVPAEALADAEGGVGVLLKARGQKPSLVPVEPGASDGALMEIREGLKEGDTILIPEGGVREATATAGNPFMPGRPARQQPGQRGGRTRSR